MDAYLPPSRIGKDYAVPDSNGSETGSTGVDSNPPARKEPASGPRKARALSGANEMTDKTDALVALADELAAAWNTAKEFDMDEFADRIRALAAPAEAVGYLSDWALLQLRANGYVTTLICAHNRRIYGDGKPPHPIYTAPPAASVDVSVSALKSIASSLNDIAVGLFNVHRIRAQQVSGLAAQLSGLIDSAGGAKGDVESDAEREFFAQDFYEEARAGKVPWPGNSTPQPAEGDGAVAWLGTNPRTGTPEACAHKPSPSVMRDFNMRPLVYADTRPSAAAAVDDAMVERACEARWSSWRNPNLRTDDARNEMRRILTAALAQQEPRHD